MLQRMLSQTFTTLRLCNSAPRFPCIFRDELMCMAKNGEFLEVDLERMRKELADEKNHRRKLERILAESAQALKTALTVREVKKIHKSLFGTQCDAQLGTSEPHTMANTQPHGQCSFFSSHRKALLRMSTKPCTSAWRRETTCWRTSWCFSTRQLPSDSGPRPGNLANSLTRNPKFSSAVKRQDPARESDLGELDSGAMFGLCGK